MDSLQTYSAVEYDVFYIDVGESEEFEVEVERTSMYRIIQKTLSSIVVLLTENESRRTILKVNWSTSVSEADSRGRIAADIASRVVRTPRTLDRMLYRWESTYVMVVYREYIEGVSANHLWDLMSHEERLQLASRVSRAVVRIAQHRSRTFGRIQGGCTRSASAVQYVNNQVFKLRMSGKLRMDDVFTPAECDVGCEPTLCHGSLTLEHVIMKDGKFAGLVGWSKADYVPEIYDRHMYYFMSSPFEYGSWEYMMSRIPISSGLHALVFSVLHELALL